MKHQLLEAAPRFGWLDRWLEPRWRALLTWVGLAAVTGATVPRIVPAWIPQRTVWLISDISYKYLGFSIPDFVDAAALFANVSVLAYWFQPIILRVGLLRTLIWLALGGVVLLLVEIVDPPSGWTVLSGQVFGIGGVAVLGVRTRFWLSLVGGGLAFAILSVLEWKWRISLCGQMIIGNLIYGAIMLYGTKPLPRSTSTNVLSSLPKPL